MNSKVKRFFVSEWFISMNNQDFYDRLKVMLTKVTKYWKHASTNPFYDSNELLVISKNSILKERNTL